MNSFKKSLSLILAFVFIFGCIPSTLFVVADDKSDANTIDVGYYEGMTVAELVHILNKNVGLPEDTPVDAWEWYSRPEVEYEYGKYLVDVEYTNELFNIDVDEKNVNLIRALEVHDRYLAGEITDEELERDYPEAYLLFKKLSVDHEKLKAQVDDALDQAERKEASQKAYVSLYGKENVVNGKTIELDRENDPHCVYTAEIKITEEQNLVLHLNFATRLVVNGTQRYPGIIEGMEKGEKIQVRCKGQVYTLNVHGVLRSELVLKGVESYIYPISFNSAVGETELDILEKIYNEVVDFEASKLADDFIFEEKNGFTVRFYDNTTGWYEFDGNESGRIVAGNVYEIEMIYEGDTTAREDFKIAVYDPRKLPTIAIYEDEKLIIQKTDTETIKEEIFNNLIDKSDLPEDVKYTDFEYYYYLSDYSGIMDNTIIAKATDTSNSKVKNFSDSLYEYLWNIAKESIKGTPMDGKISKEEFKERYFTKEFVQEKLKINDWIPLEGCSYPITIDFEGEEIEVFSVEIPSILAGHDYPIKTVYKGNEDHQPSEAVSQEHCLQIVYLTSDLEVVDGAYLQGTDAEGLVEVEGDFEYILFGLELDVYFLETVGVYVDIPPQFRGLFNITYGDGYVLDTVTLLEMYLTQEDYRLGDFLEFLEELDAVEAENNGTEPGQTSFSKNISRLKDLIRNLPTGAMEAPVNYGGLPEAQEGIYLVCAMTADLNCIPYYDDGLCFIVSELEKDFYIEFDNEIPEGICLEEGEEFDFTAHVYGNDGEPYEDDPEAYSVYFGYETDSEEGSYFSDMPPMTKGEYVQISISGVANPQFRYFDIGLMQTYIESPGDEFEYDGLPHGKPIITDIEGNILSLDKENDLVVYTNLSTNEITTKAPTAVGEYYVTVIFSGDENHKRATGTYTFKIVPKVIDLWVGDYESVYGDALPNFILNCEDPELLDDIKYTITPDASYKGGVGKYSLVITILSAPEGYSFSKTMGSLTIIPRDITIKMDEDIEITYDDEDYDPDDPDNYTVIEGAIVGEDKLGLIFEKYENVGEYVYAPTDYTNKNYNLTVIPGVVRILPKEVTLRIKYAMLYEGDDLPEFEFYGECPEKLRPYIHIAPAYYDGTPGTYTLFGVNENPNYDVTIVDNVLDVLRRVVNVEVTVGDYDIVYGDKLPKFEVVTDKEVEDVEFEVEVIGYNGNAGTYKLDISAVGAYSKDKYKFNYNCGTLTVHKKDLTVKVKDYNTVYGNKFDPNAVYLFECLDPSVDLDKILKYKKIGAENFNGDAGSYLLIGKGIADNYNIIVESGTLTVDPKPITVIPTEGQGKFEGEEDGTLTYEVEGLVGKDVLEGELSREEGEDIGVYEILLGSLSNPNYSITLLKEIFAVRSKDYKGIKIVKLPENLVYLQGTDFNPEGMEVVAITNKGEEIALEYGTDYSVIGFDSSVKSDRQKLAVCFKGHIAGFEVCIVPSDVSVVKIDKLPEKLVYIEGQPIDFKGISVVVFYDNGTYEYMDEKYLNFSGYDMSTLGKQKVKVEFGGKSDSFDITVIEKSVYGIEIDTAGVKKEYIEGQPFTADGLRVYELYTDGSKVEVTDSGLYTVTGYNTSKVGTQDVLVSYGSFIATYEINVIKKIAASLKLEYQGEQLYVVQGCDFDPSQLKVTVIYNDGETKVISYGEYLISGYDKNEIGIQASKVEFEEASADVLVRVVSSSIVNIEIAERPIKDFYVLGQELDLTGLKVIANINNGTVEVIEGYDVRGFDGYMLGAQDLEVSYLGYKATLRVTVVSPSFEGIKLTKLPDNMVFVEGLEPDYTGIEAEILSDEGGIITVDDFIFSEIDNNVLGVHTVIARYGNAECEFEIEIVAKSVVSIEVATDKNITMVPGSAPELGGATVVVYYDNGSVEKLPLTLDMITLPENNKTGKYESLVKYGGAETNVDVWVVKAEIEEMIITKYPDTQTYPEGTVLNVSDMEILIKYKGGISEYIWGYQCDIEGYNSTLIGTQTLTAIFANAKVNFTVDVTPKVLTNIVVDTLPYKTVYVYSQALDLTGLKIMGIYDNGESVEISAAKYVIDGYSPEEYGEQTITVSYNGLTASFKVEVIKRAPVRIEVDTSNTVTDFFLGNKFVYDGLKVYLVYNDESREAVSASKCTFVEPYMSKAGKASVMVEYTQGNKTFDAFYEINISEEAPIDIVVYLNGMSTTTVEGTPHNFGLIKVVARYRDGIYREIGRDNYTIENYDYQTSGIYDTRFVFGEYEFVLKLTVSPKDIGLELTKRPDKQTYIKGQKIDLDGIILTVFKSDGSAVEVPMSKIQVNTVLDSVGIVSVELSYEEFTVSYDVLVYGYSASDLVSGVDGYSAVKDSSKYIVVDGLARRVTLAELKAALNGGEFITSISGDENEVLTTGTTLFFREGDNEYAIYTVVVRGDLDGDGRLNITDATKIYHSILGKVELSEIEKIAADVVVESDETNVNITDALKALHTVRG